MKNFDIQRFRNVARWDLSVNRSFYSKMAFAIFALMGITVLGYMTTIWWDANSNDGESVALQMMAGAAFLNMQITLFTRYFGMLPFLFGFMFHNLRTRQGRINELTLPATNLEKFVWHICFILFGSLGVAVVSYLVLDVIQFLFTGLVLDFDTASFMICNYGWVNGLHELETELLAGSQMHDVLVMMVVCACCAHLAFVSTFALGNALKYRHNVVLTMIFHLVVFFAVMFLLVFFVMLVMNNSRFFLRWFYEEEVGLAVSSLIFLGITALCWWRTWVLYKRAQITTKRNK